MQAILTPRTPLEANSSFFQQSKIDGLYIDARTVAERPLSTATEIVDTDFEDDSSDVDEYSPKPSFDSDTRRRSQTTISSFDEVPTPSSSRNSGRRLELTIKPVEGPSGPHLFRSSQVSAEFTFDHALQMSPLLPKPMTFRPETTFTEDTLTQEPQAIHGDSDYDEDDRIRQWGTQDVVDWMLDAGLDSSVIECFEINDVDGIVLLDLDFDDLKELGIPSFGKRHQLWNAIADLRGLERIVSPQPTPFQDTSRPCTTKPVRSLSRRTSSRRGSVEDELEPTTPGGKKRRGRKPSRDIVTPAESVSIVAIEQLLPKAHVCSKGERCAKWRKQQRELAQLQSENGLGRFPISPTKGGRIHVTGDPGNAATADNLIPNTRLHIDTSKQAQTGFPLESAGFPSVVASSGLLSPDQLPAIALHQDVLNQIAHRDPQDNVKQFLDFQHMHSPVIPVDDAPPSPPSEFFPARASLVRRSGSVPPLFPEQFHQAYPSLQTTVQPAAPHQGLKSLPRLDIPRPSTADPSLAGRSADPVTAIPDSACRTAIPSPAQVYRLGTPASEMDVPCATSLETLSRDASQSVPPNMQYRQPPRTVSRAARRPSALPAVKEGEIFSTGLGHQPRPSISSSNSSCSVEKVRDPAHHSPTTIHFGYGESCSHAGWMKKRKTKLLRHEWQDAHFRLRGTRLDMHANARISAATLDTINVNEYAVNCSTTASNGKLSAAMKAFNIKNDKAKAVDATAFAFQLVPSREGHSEEQRKKLEKKTPPGKTHHFAVNTKDERIDWMREIMLAKALQQKGRGYNVEINGQAA